VVRRPARKEHVIEVGQYVHRRGHIPAVHLEEARNLRIGVLIGDGDSPLIGWGCIVAEA
jgi:hypothetical protein